MKFFFSTPHKTRNLQGYSKVAGNLLPLFSSEEWEITMKWFTRRSLCVYYSEQNLRTQAPILTQRLNFCAISGTDKTSLQAEFELLSTWLLANI